MKFIEASKKKDAHTEEWIVIILSVIFAYLINKHSDPIIIKFLNSKGATINEDIYSLSELIQFVWRSAIRDNKPINLYIPSERMRNIFKAWLDNEI